MYCIHSAYYVVALIFALSLFRSIIIIFAGVGIGTAVAQQLVGIDAIQYFLMFIIEEAGIDERVWQSILLIALGVLKLVVIVFAGSLFDTKGRRPLFFWSLIGESKGIMNNICLIELKAFYCFLKVWQFLLL